MKRLVAAVVALCMLVSITGAAMADGFDLEYFQNDELFTVGWLTDDGVIIFPSLNIADCNLTYDCAAPGYENIMLPLILALNPTSADADLSLEFLVTVNATESLQTDTFTFTINGTDYKLTGCDISTKENDGVYYELIMFDLGIRNYDLFMALAEAGWDVLADYDDTRTRELPPATVTLEGARNVTFAVPDDTMIVFYMAVSDLLSLGCTDFLLSNVGTTMQTYDHVD